MLYLPRTKNEQNPIWKGDAAMIFWQYDAKKNFERLSERLLKYKGGQLLLRTDEGELRGPVTDYEETGPKIAFRLQWLAKKKILSNSRWNPEWKWQLTHEPASTLICSITLEFERGAERGPKDESGAGTESSIFTFGKIKKFYQNKQKRLGGVVFPKCLFFTTTLGERGTLFQLHDPRNLQLEGETILDPGALPKYPKRSL